MLTAAGSLLVAVPKRGSDMGNVLGIEATRGFMWKGKVIAAGDVVDDMPELRALELIAMNKAVRVPIPSSLGGHKMTKEDEQVEKDEREATVRAAKKAKE